MTASLTTSAVVQPSQTPLHRGGGTAVVGLQWGDEGKGKIVHILAERHEIVARYNGGANAGHSVVVNGERFALHLIPSGILHPGKPSVIGNGVVVDPEQLLKEIDLLTARGVDCSGLVVSDRAHVVMPWHKAEDEAREAWLSQAGVAVGPAVKAIGTTKRGIGPCYADKAQRGTAIRMGDLLHPDALREKLRLVCPLKTAILRAMVPVAAGTVAPSFDHDVTFALAAGWGARLKDRIKDTSALLIDRLEAGDRILYEGANATLLDVDHGTYPFVTASSTTALGIPSGVGVPMSSIGTILGVCKAYTSRVGSGAMPTELHNELGERIRQRGREFGTTTGRPRRVGWLDLVATKFAARLNGVNGLCIMLLDVLSGLDELQVCVGYDTPAGRTQTFTPDGGWLDSVKPAYQTLRGFSGELTSARSLAELPTGARAYLDLIENFVGVPIRMVSVGPDRAQTIEVA